MRDLLIEVDIHDTRTKEIFIKVLKEEGVFTLIKDDKILCFPGALESLPYHSKQLYQQCIKDGIIEIAERPLNERRAYRIVTQEVSARVLASLMKEQ
jgi:hypothetical protein